MSSAGDPTGDPAPVPLRIAGALTALEGLAFLVLAAWLAPNLRAERPALGITTMAFFLLFGLFLLFCARQLVRRRSWARAPIVAAQLILLLVAASFWGGRTTVVTVAGVAAAVAILVGVFHPRSLAALESE